MSSRILYFFFFNDTATTEIYTLSLHDALPISLQRSGLASESRVSMDATLTSCEVWMSIVSAGARIDAGAELERSEEHTSELQSQSNLVCRLLLEKKKQQNV